MPTKVPQAEVFAAFMALPDHSNATLLAFLDQYFLPMNSELRAVVCGACLTFFLTLKYFIFFILPRVILLVALMNTMLMLVFSCQMIGQTHQNSSLALRTLCCVSGARYVITNNLLQEILL